MPTRILPFIAALAVLCQGGCEETDRLKVYPVRGEVKVDGRPASGARVFFHPSDRLDDPRGLHPFAVVEADGTFHLTTYLALDGAPAGDYVVTVTWPLRTDSDDEASGDRLKHKFADPKKSPLRATVKPEDNILEPFLLP